MSRPSLPSLSAVSPHVQSGLAVIGAVSVVSCTYRAASFVWCYFLRPRSSPMRSFGQCAKNKNVKNGGNSWAIVTGGSAGVGRHCAIELAKEGFSIILLARNQGHLDKLASEIERTYGVATKCLSFDASHAALDGNKVVNSLLEENGLRKLDIAVVVNNVGIHNARSSALDAMPYDVFQRMINVNLEFTVLFTQALIPQLRSRKQRSCIVNISSLTSGIAMPYLTVYAATKAFIDQFSVGLAAELELDNIAVVSARVGLTTTAMSGIENSNLAAPSAAIMGKAVVDNCMRPWPSSPVIVPYWVHACMDGVNAWVPQSMSWDMARKMNMALAHD